MQSNHSSCFVMISVFSSLQLSPDLLNMTIISEVNSELCYVVGEVK